ncbi:MAG: DUF1282 family protein [Candidatus Aminicenantes bacterium]|nr:MAG: DUF1282 family protein [Candidatus Aminicenantes bacterium]
MDFNAIIKRAIAIITKPKDEWTAIHSESLTIKDLYLKYAIILYAIPSVALLVGWLIMGLPIMMTLVMAIFLYVLTIGVLFLMGLLIEVIGSQFGGTKDMVSSQKLAVFSLTPYALIGILFIIPIGRFAFGSGIFYLIMLISLYSFYIMYLGAQKLKGITQPDKLLPLTLIMAVIWLILIYIAYRISASIAFEAFLGSFRAALRR